jgi:copper oxidase (laccase) domain-containing protein
LPMCTSCTRDAAGEHRFLSFRRDGTREVMWSGIAVSDAGLS